ncbi:MAG: hypothetical protein V1797_03485 [Pseudomonadota bacterium]
MNATIPYVQQPLTVGISLQESIWSFGIVLLGLVLVLAILGALIWLGLRRGFFWLLDRHILRMKPALIFRYEQNVKLDDALSLAGKACFNFGKRSFRLQGVDTWTPGVFKGRRKLVLAGREVAIKGRYKPRGGEKLVTFDLVSGDNPLFHRVVGLDDEFVLLVVRDVGEKRV